MWCERKAANRLPERLLFAAATGSPLSRPCGRRRRIAARSLRRCAFPAPSAVNSACARGNVLLQVRNVNARGDGTQPLQVAALRLSSAVRARSPARSASSPFLLPRRINESNCPPPGLQIDHLRRCGAVEIGHDVEAYFIEGGRELRKRNRCILLVMGWKGCCGAPYPATTHNRPHAPWRQSRAGRHRAILAQGRWQGAQRRLSRPFLQLRASGLRIGEVEASGSSAMRTKEVATQEQRSAAV